MKIEKTKTGIQKAIKSIVRRSGTLQSDIQAVALACLEHTKQHGDWTLSRELLEGISATKGVKYNKLKQWFEAMMAASYVKGPNKEMIFVYDEGRSAKDINLEMAAAVNWWDFKTEPKDNSKELEAIPELVARALAKSLKSGKVSDEEASAINEAVKEVVANLIEARLIEETLKAA